MMELMLFARDPTVVSDGFKGMKSVWSPNSSSSRSQDSPRSGTPTANSTSPTPHTARRLIQQPLSAPFNPIIRMGWVGQFHFLADILTPQLVLRVFLLGIQLVSFCALLATPLSGCLGLLPTTPLT
jgi:hypothetical protein